MKKNWLFLMFMVMVIPVFPQGPCTLKLDSITIDPESTCSHLFFKYKYSGGNPTSYKWNYGDGNSCTCFKPKNFYNQNGVFQVCGRIQDSNGCADSLCISVNINCSDPCELSVLGINSADTLSYSCSEFEFNTITSDNTKKIKWDFGDGDSSTSKYIIHNFKSNGIYNVVLSIADSIGCADTALFSVTIDCPSSCDFVINKLDTASGVDCKTKNFVLASNRTAKSVWWDFGDSHFKISGTSTSYTYTDTGLFKVCAEGTDSNDCKDTFCTWVRVNCAKSSGIVNAGEFILSIYPEPFVQNIYIESEQTFKYTIYDPGYRKIKDGSLKPGINILELESLAPGTYFIKIENEGQVMNYRITKQ